MTSSHHPEIFTFIFCIILPFSLLYFVIYPYPTPRLLLFIRFEKWKIGETEIDRETDEEGDLKGSWRECTSFQIVIIHGPSDIYRSAIVIMSSLDVDCRIYRLLLFKYCCF